MGQFVINTTAAQDTKLIARFGSAQRAKQAARDVLVAWFIGLDDDDFAAQKNAERNVNRQELKDFWDQLS